MIPLIVILIVLAALCAFYLFAIRPETRRKERLRPFEAAPVAHRGLFDNPVIPENSMPAFRRAVEAGFPIELDVQLTTDDRLVVFHDDTLTRVCGDPRKIYEVAYEELQKLRLFDTDERIPLFEDVLALIGGKVPLVMELKPDGRHLETARRASEMLKNYRGEVCLESFHPGILKWYKDNDPEMIRGLLSTNYFREDDHHPAIVKFLLTNLLFNFLAKPDFISYNRLFRDQFTYRLCRALYKPGNAAWTIKSQEQLDEAREVFTIFIFDSFVPSRDGGGCGSRSGNGRS